MDIVSTTDNAEQIAEALRYNGFEVEPQPTEPKPTAEPEVPAASTEAVEPDEEAKTAGESETPPAEQVSQDQQQTKNNKKASGLQKRFDELTRERYQEKGRADQLSEELKNLRDEIAALKAGKPAEVKAEPVVVGPQKPQHPGKAPRISDFKDKPEEYDAALDTWEAASTKYQDDLAEYTRERAVLDSQKAETERQAQAESEARKQKTAERWEIGRQNHDDFDAVAFSSNVQTTPAILDAVLNDDPEDGEWEPEEIFYWLGSNPEEAEAIVQKTKYDMNTATAEQRLKVNRTAARIVERIRLEIAKGKSTTSAETPAAPATLAAVAPARPAPVKQSTAPAPIKPLSGAGTSTPAPNGNRVIGQNGWTMQLEREFAKRTARRP